MRKVYLVLLNHIILLDIANQYCRYIYKIYALCFKITKYIFNFFIIVYQQLIYYYYVVCYFWTVRNK